MAIAAARAGCLPGPSIQSRSSAGDGARATTARTGRSAAQHEAKLLVETVYIRGQAPLGHKVNILSCDDATHSFAI